MHTTYFVVKNGIGRFLSRAAARERKHGRTHKDVRVDGVSRPLSADDRDLLNMQVAAHVATAPDGNRVLAVAPRVAILEVLEGGAA